MPEIFTVWIPLGVFFSVLQVVFFIIFTFAKSLIRSSTAFEGTIGWEVNQDLKIFALTVFWSSSSSSLTSSSGASGNGSSSRSQFSSSLLLIGSLTQNSVHPHCSARLDRLDRQLELRKPLVLKKIYICYQTEERL